MPNGASASGASAPMEGPGILALGLSRCGGCGSRGRSAAQLLAQLGQLAAQARRPRPRARPRALERVLDRRRRRGHDSDRSVVDGGRRGRALGDVAAAILVLGQEVRGSAPPSGPGGGPGAAPTHGPISESRPSSIAARSSKWCRRSVRCFSSPGVCGPRSVSTASRARRGIVERQGVVEQVAVLRGASGVAARQANEAPPREPLAAPGGSPSRRSPPPDRGWSTGCRPAAAPLSVSG